MGVIDFDKEFIKGSAAFEGFLADWWMQKSNDPAHRRAYRNIAAKMYQTLSVAGVNSPQFIVDYACGNGAILKNLAVLFPDANIIAVDGSKKMLSLAKAALDQEGLNPEFVNAQNAFLPEGPSLRLLHAPLPVSSLPEAKADVVLFLFPNITISSSERRAIRERSQNDSWTLKTARLLAKLNEVDSGIESQELIDDLLDSRAISSNIHNLLKKGGFWFHVEYANAPRGDWDEIDQLTTLFEEASWDVLIGEESLERNFRLLKSWYFRSSVMLDVYEQSGDPDDRQGGYVISLLQSL